MKIGGWGDSASSSRAIFRHRRDEANGASRVEKWNEACGSQWRHPLASRSSRAASREPSRSRSVCSTNVATARATLAGRKSGSAAASSAIGRQSSKKSRMPSACGSAETIRRVR